MTKINHRRKNKLPVALRHEHPHNGYSIPAMHSAGEPAKTKHEIETTDPRESYQRVGRTRYLDKSLHSWGGAAPLAGRSIGASIGNDFSNGHRGMAHAVSGAKKYVRSRIRFHENAATKKLVDESFD